MDAQCIFNTTRVCLKAMEKHFFLLSLSENTSFEVKNTPLQGEKHLSSSAKSLPP